MDRDRMLAISLIKDKDKLIILFLSFFKNIGIIPNTVDMPAKNVIINGFIIKKI